jgi:hypothetical protein
MKNAYPRREKDRWEHALTSPLSLRTKFELLELMRADLFEYLDVLTTNPYNDKAEDRAMINREIQRVADRLKGLTPARAKALRAAFKAGRVEYAFPSKSEVAHIPRCGPTSTLVWKEVHELWEAAQ